MGLEIIERMARFEGDKVDPEFRGKVEALAETDVKKCYQCAKCTAGCPMNEYFDYGPHQLIRLINLGLKDRALSSKAIWFCVSCMTCTTRCPMEIKIDECIDVMREMAVAEGKVGEAAVTTFHRYFLDTVKKYGRVYEMGMLMRYRTKRMQFFGDMDLGAMLMAKGRMGVIPHSVKAREEIREMFEKLAPELEHIEAKVEGHSEAEAKEEED